jgi:hypothetical protein
MTKCLDTVLVASTALAQTTQHLKSSPLLGDASMNLNGTLLDHGCTALLEAC